MKKPGGIENSKNLRFCSMVLSFLDNQPCPIRWKWTASFNITDACFYLHWLLASDFMVQSRCEHVSIHSCGPVESIPIPSVFPVYLSYAVAWPSRQACQMHGMANTCTHPTRDKYFVSNISLDLRFFSMSNVWLNLSLVDICHTHIRFFTQAVVCISAIRPFSSMNLSRSFSVSPFFTQSLSTPLSAVSHDQSVGVFFSHFYFYFSLNLCLHHCPACHSMNMSLSSLECHVLPWCRLSAFLVPPSSRWTWSCPSGWGTSCWGKACSTASSSPGTFVKYVRAKTCTFFRILPTFFCCWWRTIRGKSEFGGTAGCCFQGGK